MCIKNGHRSPYFLVHAIKALLYIIEKDKERYTGNTDLCLEKRLLQKGQSHIGRRKAG